MPGQLALIVKRMQVRDGLAHGKRHLVQVKFALEEDRNDVGGALRCRTGLHHFFQAFVMVGILLRDALMQSLEGLAMGRQHQGVGRKRLVCGQ